MSSYNRARSRYDCPKFRPFPPVVYTAMAHRLTELSPDVAQRVERFYNALEAADRQIHYLNEHPQEGKFLGGSPVRSNDIINNETRMVIRVRL